MSCDCKEIIIKVNPLTGKGDKGDQGIQGVPGDPTTILPISTDDILFHGQVLTPILDELFYVPLVISSFIASPSTYEKGIILTSQAVSWVFNKSIQSQVITGVNVVSPSLLLGDRAVVLTLTNISIDTIITLTVDDILLDTHSPKIATTTIKFLNKLYYGKALIGTLNSAFLLALSTQPLSSVRQVSFNSNTGLNEYIWFACPTAYGTASFKTNGFNGGFTYQSTISFTNASGHTESYDIYRSDNHNLGLTAVDVL